MFELLRDSKGEITGIKGTYDDTLNLTAILEELAHLIQDDGGDELFHIARSYENLLPDQAFKRNFIKVDTETVKTKMLAGCRRTLIGRFLFKLEKYVEVDFICTMQIKNNICENCKEENEEATCLNCGLVSRIETERVNIPETEQRYSEQTNFIKALHKHTGRIDLSRAMMIEIKKRLEEYIKIRCIEPDQINRYVLRQALKSIGFPQYDFIGTIGHFCFNWPLPDIRHLEEEIINIYQITQQAYHKIPGKKSNLSVNFRLYATLKYLGHECKRSEFNLPKLQQTFDRNRDLWRQMLELSGLSTQSVAGL